ncbi:MAG: phage protease [Candidatus Cloacimonetes bacterium]|nr:phage protease [Candidatus Cloacimonadota bacterium]
MAETILISCKNIELSLSGMSGDSNIIKVVAGVTGEWDHWSGKFHISNEDLQNIKADFEYQKRDVLFDYDHNSLSLGGNSIAAGWGKKMIVNGGNLEIEVEFTPEGMNRINNKEYRYLSPVYVIEDGTKRMRNVTLHSVALTNTPFLKELPVILNTTFFKNNHTYKTQEGVSMEIKNLCKILSCSEDDILDTTKGIMHANTELVKQNEALKSQNIELLKLKEKLEKDILSQNESIAENAVNLAIANAQLREDQKTWALSLYKKDRSLYDEFVKENSVVRAPQGEMELPTNNHENKKVVYSELINNPVLLSEYIEKFPSELEKIRENYYANGGT